MFKLYDRQVILDTFAINSIFKDVIIAYPDNYWFGTNFKAVNKHNVSMLFHVINNENLFLDIIADGVR